MKKKSSSFKRWRWRIIFVFDEDSNGKAAERLGGREKLTKRENANAGKEMFTGEEKKKP